MSAVCPSSTAAVQNMSNLIIRSGTCGGGVEDFVLFQVGMADGSSRQGPGGTRVRWLHRCAYVRIRLSDAVKLRWCNVTRSCDGKLEGVRVRL
jgi:hypothetical protein